MSQPVRRLRYANRQQMEIRCESLDQLLPDDHPVRAVWHHVETLDLSLLLNKIRSLPGQPGAAAFDPRILLALWLYATIDGIGSSRALEDLCQNHLAYRWLCGDLAINYHTLSDFRTDHDDFLTALLTDSVATLLHADIVTLQQVAQDGMRVRASAGASSFRREVTIQEALHQASAQVEALQAQRQEDTGAASRRVQAAKERHAREKLERLQEAQKALQQLRQSNAERPPSRQVKAEDLRASTTDAEARKMKMPDGGFRPAYNVQLATAVVSGVIVAVAVTNAGTDANEMEPMIAQMEQRYQRRPEEMLVDGGFADLDAIDAVQTAGTTVYAPVREEKKQLAQGKDPYARKAKDTEQTAEWRARMGTEPAKTKYKLRASTAEWVNAQIRNRGLYGVRVRGQKKVHTLVLWHVLAHNFGRGLKRMVTLAVEKSDQRVEQKG